MRAVKFLSWVPLVAGQGWFSENSPEATSPHFGASGTNLGTVTELGPDTIAPHLKENAITLVAFYAPWCQYCKQLLPQLKVLSEQVKSIEDVGDKISIAQVDANAHRDVGKKYGVYAFPTIKLFVDDAFFEYPTKSRDLSFQGILKWLRGHLQRDHIVNSVTELSTFLAEHETAAVLLSDGSNAGMNAAFQRVEKHYEEVSFVRAVGNSAEDLKAMSASLTERFKKTCQVINIGATEKGPKTHLLTAGKKWECHNRPQNEQMDDWRDTFDAMVEETEKGNDQWHKLIVQRTDVDESGEVGTGFAEKDGFEISSEKKFRLGSKDMSTTLFCSQYIIWLTNVHRSSNPFHHLQF